METLGKDGPADLDRGASVFELPHIGAQPGAFLLPVPDVALVCIDAFFGWVDGQPSVVLLLDSGQGGGVGN